MVEAYVHVENAAGEEDGYFYLVMKTVKTQELCTTISAARRITSPSRSSASMV